MLLVTTGISQAQSNHSGKPQETIGPCKLGYSLFEAQNANILPYEWVNALATTPFVLSDQSHPQSRLGLSVEQSQTIHLTLGIFV